MDAGQMDDLHTSEAARGRAADQAGADFERRIVNVYNLLGFTVEHDVNLNSSQTDLICSKETPGAPSMKLYVECKYRSTKTVSKPEVATFLATYDQLKIPHRLTSGVMVSKLGFSGDAKDFASLRPDIRLITESELNDDLLNVSLTLRRYIEQYEKLEIAPLYIPLRTDDGYDLAERCKAWLTESTRLLVTLGDFGAGKTTFTRQLNYILAMDYLSGSGARVPFYLSLREFGRFPDLRSFVESNLMREFDTSDYMAFTQLLQNGRLLLLLDGFDEMGAQMDAAARQKSFSTLTNLFPRGSKAIITCRPAYFITDSEMREMFTFMQDYIGREGTFISESGNPEARLRRGPFKAFSEAASDWVPSEGHVQPIRAVDVAYVNIDTFTEPDIILYVNRQSAAIEKAGKTQQWVLDKIRGTYDLMDLARRPILLNLMLSTLPKIPEDVEPSPSVIYDQYVESWMEVEYSKGPVRWLIKRSDKMLFMTELAFFMNSEGRVQLHYSELPDPICEYFKIRSLSDLKHFVTDIQGCSFLKRDRNGNFEFIHKSFGEFFTAVYINERCKSGNAECLAKVRLSPEVLFFLGDLAYHESTLKARLQEIARSLKAVKTEEIVTDNVIGALGYSRSIISSSEWRNLSIERLHFIHCSLYQVLIETESTERIVLDRCDIRETSITSTGAQVSILQSKCEGLHIKASVSSSEGPGIIVRSGMMKDSDLFFDGCRLRFEAGFEADRVAVIGSRKAMLEPTSAQPFGVFEANSGAFRSCTISNCRLGALADVDVQDCWFLGVLALPNDRMIVPLPKESALMFQSPEEARSAHLAISRLVAQLKRECASATDLRLRLLELTQMQCLSILWMLDIIPTFSPNEPDAVINSIVSRLESRWKRTAVRGRRRG
jgi:hypothetical protein